MKKYKFMLLWISQLLVLLLNLGLQLILSRLFTLESAGAYFSIIALLNMSTTIGLFGLNKYLLIIYTKFKNITNKAKQNLVIIFVVLNSLGIIIFLILSFLAQPNNLLFSFFLVPLFITNNLVAVYTALVQVASKYLEISFSKIIIPFSKVISILLVGYFFQSDLKLVGLIIGIINIIFIFYLLINIYKSFGYFFDKNIYPNDESLKLEKFTKTFLVLLPFAILNLTFMIYTQGNIFFLGTFESNESTAYFSNAYLLLNTFYIFPTILFQQVLAHKLYKLLYKNDTQEISNFITLTKPVIVYLSGIIILILFLFSEKIILLLFGSNYYNSIVIFQVLILSIPFRFISISQGTIMASDYFVKSRVKIEVFVTTTNLLTNIILINLIGLNGAIVSVLITEFMMAVLFSMKIDRSLDIKKKNNLILILLTIPYAAIYFNLPPLMILVIIMMFSILLLFSANKLIIIVKEKY